MLAACGLMVVALLATPTAYAAIIVNDSWADGGRNDGVDPEDSNWWTSAASQGIEVSVGSLGMVTGGSGRGIHTIFPTQTLAVNQRLIATYTFTTPATVGAGGTAGLRIGLFDTLGRAALNADVSASSGTPNAVYGYFAAGTVGLPGYMMDMDVNGGATSDLNFRQHDTPVNVPAQTPTGRLMGTTTGFTSFTSGPDAGYSFAPNTTYTGSLTLHRINDTQMRVSGALGTVTHSVTDVFDSADVGMLAFWSNSGLFGSSSTPNTPNNGIDFSNVRIEIVPEPSSLLLGMLALTVSGNGAFLRRHRNTSGV
jgi:hypothetical protein